MITYSTINYRTVYLCERKHNKLKVVVKEVSIDLNNPQIESAKNEVSVLKSLKHSNIVQYYDSFVSSGVFYIVMEYANKGSLYDFIKKQKENLIPQQVSQSYCNAKIITKVNF